MQRWVKTERQQRKGKINSKIPASSWPPPQYEKLQVLKFRLGTYVPPSPSQKRGLPHAITVASEQTEVKEKIIFLFLRFVQKQCNVELFFRNWKLNGSASPNN